MVDRQIVKSCLAHHDSKSCRFNRFRVEVVDLRLKVKVTGAVIYVCAIGRPIGMKVTGDGHLVRIIRLLEVTGRH